jgi:hypothetical protein
MRRLQRGQGRPKGVEVGICTLARAADQDDGLDALDCMQLLAGALWGRDGDVR